MKLKPFADIFNNSTKDNVNIVILVTQKGTK